MDDVDLTTLCTCSDYQHEVKMEAALCIFAYFHGIPLPQIPWKFCPYCGREFKYPVRPNNGVQPTAEAARCEGLAAESITVRQPAAADA